MPVIQKGVVSWSGENPGIYLKSASDPQGDWQVLALYFRVIASEYGRGRGILLLGDPATKAGYPAARNLCIGDNLKLMDYLLTNFVPKFGAFRGREALPHITLLQATCGSTDEKDPTQWVETIAAGDVSLSLAWKGLQSPFAADVGPSISATGEHRMYSLFQGADKGEIRLNGELLDGVVVERDFLDGKLNSAFLAFAETWVEEGSE
ncbi:hypothetical protein ACNFH5_30235 [Pseudomonas sp. NY15435]|uniref:hypothetical protein n=1 Tax=Pseudomonas sp. NY15435 TaxID=3400358 RepID=UPI003A8B9228